MLVTSPVSIWPHSKVHSTLASLFLQPTSCWTRHLTKVSLNSHRHDAGIDARSKKQSGSGTRSPTYHAQVVRKANGDVVYMETDDTFIAKLASYLHEPLGVLAVSFKTFAPELGVVKFGVSIAGLRDSLWNGNKAAMLPDSVTKSARQGGRDHQEFDPFGTVPQRQFNSMFQQMGMHSSATASAVVPYNQNGKQLPKFKNTVRFIVDNELQVHENSSVKALQLMSKAGVDLSTVRTEELNITDAQIVEMIGRCLFNCNTVLTDVLPPRRH